MKLQSFRLPYTQCIVSRRPQVMRNSKGNE